MKLCTKCDRTLSLDRFSKRTQSADGRQTMCKDCQRDAKRDWIKVSRDKVAINRLWSNYRLRENDFLALLESQNNLCAMCTKEFTETPHIDHDHSCCSSASKSCGKCVRGLLCGKCNRIVGWYEKMHNPLDTSVKMIVNYLDKLP